ncbi:MAG: ABC transporter ATP-binding protein [Vicinamibacteria bacterium]|nr:ABC transporter ATP-binding protein [Vicinamibacteria bacterium]
MDARIRHESESGPLVAIDDLRVSYGPVLALAGATCSLETGATGLLGPNGAGKTTLLRVLLGFLRPEAGRVRIFGRDPWNEPLAIRGRIGYVPEGECLIPGLCGANLVAFAGELSGLERGEALGRAHEILDFVGLDAQRYQQVETLSTGLKQRLKLAAALVHDPDLLLLDEPTDGLDPMGREEMLSLLSDVAESGRMALILCSHVLHDVERVCRKAVVLDQGRVAAAGRIAELAGPPRAGFDVRISGDPTALVTDLRDHGCEVLETEEGLRVFLENNLGPPFLFRSARDCGAQIRHLRPATPTLEDVFLRLVRRSDRAPSGSGPQETAAPQR